MKKLMAACMVCLTIISCQKDDTGQLDAVLETQIKTFSRYSSLQGLILPESADFDQIPQDANNPITAEKVALGRLLFHETALGNVPKKPSGYRTYSCASCHHAGAGFQAGVAQGIGEGGLGFGLKGEGRQADLSLYADVELDVQPIRSPSAMNGAYQEVMLWNGQFGAVGINTGTEFSWKVGTPKEKNHLGFEGLETQAIAGLDVHRLLVDDEFVASFPEYKALFDEAFPDIEPSKRYTNVTTGLAIAAYERTMLSQQAPFQQWLNGNDQAMTPAQKRGAILFFGRAGCYRCHDGPALNNLSFHALGMNDLDRPGVYSGALDDNTRKGRGGFTGRAEDDFRFKVPQLYNLKDSPFYGHGASFTSIREVVEYKNVAVPQNQAVEPARLDPRFVPLKLTSGEIDDLVEFLTNGLYDAHLDRYLPDHLLSGQCFPNNDNQSRNDLGCN